MTPNQAGIIALLRESGDISQAAIARKLMINEATVYRNIEKLKRMGLLERTGSDKTGRWVVV